MKNVLPCNNEIHLRRNLNPELFDGAPLPRPLGLVWETKMNPDPVLKELWEIKDGLATECGHDLMRLFDKLKTSQKDHGADLVNRTKKNMQIHEPADSNYRTSPPSILTILTINIQSSMLDRLPKNFPYPLSRIRIRGSAAFFLDVHAFFRKSILYETEWTEKHDHVQGAGNQPAAWSRRGGLEPDGAQKQFRLKYTNAQAVSVKKFQVILKALPFLVSLLLLNGCMTWMTAGYMQYEASPEREFIPGYTFGSVFPLKGRIVEKEDASITYQWDDVLTGEGRILE
ncbi:MAG: hypothetical protein JJU29_23100, partial [Verrucomicrobia bacterium]|nr:hypothetical protein [Verrucomicrobiota bacterium]